MLACIGADNRARGLCQYHAATPGRWSATLIQPQNLPRPIVDIATEDIENLVDAIKTCDADALLHWGKPIEGLASALRFALVAAEGMQFGAGDFSAIELCVLLALAGQSDKAALIADGVDIYRDMAVTIFGLDRDAFLAVPKNNLTVEQVEWRQVGKNPVLGCGYGMGDQTFRSRYLRHLDAEEAKTFANTVVYRHYREAWAPCVPKLWKDLERTARRAMLQPGITAKAQCGITYTLRNHNRLLVLVCRLFNGKLIHYQNARLAADFLPLDVLGLSPRPMA
jgi:DNA polymerase bacteriophage-type